MSDKTIYNSEKMTASERKKHAELERHLGVPDPAVPNRAHTEMRTDFPRELPEKKPKEF